MKFRWAAQAYKQLDGIFCVYKPSELKISQVIDKIKNNLARDLNALPCYKYERIVNNTENGSINNDKSSDVISSLSNSSSSVPVITELPAIHGADLAEHRLVLGPRYIASDFRINSLGSLQKHASGVQVFSIGPGSRLLELIRNAMYLRVYHIRGRFGWATHNFSPKGKIIERTTYYHITKPKLDKMCSTVQANHTKHMFKYAGVDENSQEAYEFAVKGLVRPATEDTSPMLYGVKCIDFNLPDFTLEIHAINENRDYFKNLIHEIGLKLKSTAVCTGVRRLRYGYFTLDHCLLQKHWSLENILENFKMCHKEIHPSKLLVGANIEENKKEALIEKTDEEAGLKLFRRH